MMFASIDMAHWQFSSRRMIREYYDLIYQEEEYPAEAEIQEQAGQACPGLPLKNNGQSKGRMFSSTTKNLLCIRRKGCNSHFFHLQVWGCACPGYYYLFPGRALIRLDLVPAFRNSSWNRGPAKFYRLFFLIKSPATGRFMFL